ncbi:MAG: hypothetical protein DRM98_04745 [Thermoplasmata archaeon]|nr:MAG: hypothetical protein DRM98_04745 [Thermoplasmata archaeon]
MEKKILSILICLFMITVSIFSVTGAKEENNNKMLIRIDVSQGFDSLPSWLDIVGSKEGKWIDVIVTPVQLDELRENNICYTVIISDVDAYNEGVLGSYHTWAQIEQILQDIANNYPDITSLYSLGTTYEGRNIWCLEVSDSPGVDEGEPGVFFMGLHHAREWPTVEICLHIADRLTSEYGSNNSITDIVNNRRIWIVPCVNPDGYYYCHDLGHDWRKNRRYFPEYNSYGVDLNRNYAGSCNGDSWGAWGSIGTGSISHYPTSEVYCGPGVFSEYETQAIRNVFLNNKICATITWHTYGELVMWPWGYTYGATPDDTYMSDIGEEIAARITQQDGTGTYTPEQSSSLYPTTGDTTDWVYGYSHYIQGRATFAYTIEACSSFHPSESYLDQVCEENFNGAFYLLEEAENISDTVTPRVLPPVIDEMTTDDDGYYVVSWEQQNPDADPDKYQLDELSDLSLVTDDAESGSNLWTLNGFSITDSKHHSGIHSFKARNQNSDVSSMTTVYPLPVNENTTLSFWCWYDIENLYDYAYVEISEDGRRYQVLDKFTGSSNGWIQKQYSLNEHAGESIFIRFRYATDSGTLGSGFFVDDIHPIADFNKVKTLSDSIHTTHYTIENNPPGEYYYRVKGHNSERGWGDFSTLENITVYEGENYPPNTPSNPHPIDGQLYVEIDTNLSWIGGDPNPGDIVTYDVYFEPNDPTPDMLVSDDQLSTTYTPGTLEYETTYYWKIIATDSHGNSTEGPVWRFTTIEEPNLPPFEPSDPHPADGANDVDVNTVLSWTGGDPNKNDIVTYDVYLGTETPPPKIASIQNQTSYNPGLLNYETTYYWKIIAKDDKGEETEGSIWMFTTGKENNPPTIPIITGPSKGKPHKEYSFTFKSTDPEGSDVYYYIDWGDDTNTGWDGPHASGEEVTLSHTWSTKDTFTIKAKAKDTTGAESDWGSLDIKIPRVKVINSFLLQLLEKISSKYPLLKHLIEYWF